MTECQPACAVIPLLQQEDFWIVNKPTGMSVQQSHHGPGVLSALKEAYAGEFYPVHRLDAGTSGLLIVARNAQGNAQLSKLFRERQVEKYYLAMSARKPDKKQGTVSGDMEKSRRGAWKLLHTQTQPAVTRFFSKGVGGNRLFLVKPYTGKTHQIRVALKSLGAPIIGDELYGGVAADRLYLHAYGLKFTYHEQDIAMTCLPPLAGAFDCLQEEENQAWIADPWVKSWPGSKITGQVSLPYPSP